MTWYTVPAGVIVQADSAEEALDEAEKLALESTRWDGASLVVSTDEELVEVIPE